MALFRRRQDTPQTPPPAPPRVAAPSAPPRQADPSQDQRINWSDIEIIRKEWPLSSLDAEADLAKWQQGMALYERDDYASMMQCATLLATALAHSLYGPGIIHGDDFPNTVFRTLYASLEAPPDGQTFAESARRSSRLALTLIRENGWQPSSMGGSGLFDQLIMDKGNFMLLTTATSPTGLPWDGGLQAFFSVTPQSMVDPLPNPDENAQVVDRVFETMKRAEAGDPASEHHMNGMALWANGRLEEAMSELEEAAKLGSAQAMKDAGDLAADMGQTDQARFWFESAANAGDSAAMWNMAVIAVNVGDLATAESWYLRSAEAGLTEGYAALTQLADDRGDEIAKKRWARLGAEQGQTFCMTRYGMYLLMEPNTDTPTIRQARDFLEQAADRGDIDAMGLAVSANSQLGDQARAQRFIQMVVATGNEEKLEILRRHGYL
jgi:TPR repeat protein